MGKEKPVQGVGGKPEGKKTFGKPRRRWKDNVKMDIQEERCEGID
jgi:hypothetical protein